MAVSFIGSAFANMPTEAKDKLGQTGTRINEAGAHLVKIISFYQGDYEGNPNIQITFEDMNGKTVDWSGNLTTTISLNKDGEPARKSYQYQGKPLTAPKKGDICDNISTFARIKAIMEICGTTVEEASSHVVEEDVESFGKTIKAPVFKSLIGKKLTIVTSTEVSVSKDNKVYRNQKPTLDYVFNEDGLSTTEISKGVSVESATQLKAAVELANKPKEPFASIGYGIKYGQENNKLAIAELKLVAHGNNAPVVEDVTEPDEDADIF